MLVHRTKVIQAIYGAVLLAFCPLGVAQAPDAGSALRDLQQPSLSIPSPGQQPILTLPNDAPRDALPSDIFVNVERFNIEGNEVIASDSLLALVQDLRGQQLSLAQLYEATDRLTAAYQEQGYVLSRAYIPAQEISPEQSVVTLTVLEGRFGSVDVENESLLSDSSVQRMIADFKPGDIVNAEPLEQQLLRIDDLPGVAVQTRLGAGTLPGTADLVVIAQPQARVSGNIGIDNQGNLSTGKNRVNARFAIASPFGRGDDFSVNVLYSDEDQLFYQTAYNLPMGASKYIFGMTASRMDYQLAGNFADLEAAGTADTLGLNLRHSWVRSRLSNLRVDYAVEHRILNDSLGNGATTTEKGGLDFSVGVSGDRRDEFGNGGVNVFSTRLIHGEVRLEDGTFAPETPKGSFNKLVLSALRLQNLGERSSLYLAFQAQLADVNLDSSQKMMIGGAQGVRAYPLGEGSADQGALLNLELRYRVTDNMQLKLIGDAAYANLIKEPFAPEDNYRVLSGLGLGLDWQSAAGLRFSIVAAKHSGDAPISEDEDSARVWASAQWLF